MPGPPQPRFFTKLGSFKLQEGGVGMGMGVGMQPAVHTTASARRQSPTVVGRWSSHKHQFLSGTCAALAHVKPLTVGIKTHLLEIGIKERANPDQAVVKTRASRS